MYAFRIKAGDNPQALHRRLSFKNANSAMRPKGHIGLNETGFQTTLTIPATFATEPSDVDATAVTPWTPHVPPSLWIADNARDRLPHRIIGSTDSDSKQFAVLGFCYRGNRQERENR